MTLTFREVPFTANRQVIYDFLSRASRFHCPVSASLEMDITETLARIEAEKEGGRSIGLVAFLVKATARLLEVHPKLNHHVFTSWFGRVREVAWDQINCTLIVARDGPGGEEMLFPMVIRVANELTVDAVHDLIRQHKQKRVEDLKQLKAMERIRKMPRFALRWFSYKTRSDPTFYAKYFGTYGLSSLLQPDGPGVGGATVANTASAFLPGTIMQRPRVIDGEIVPRTVLSMGVVIDHYVVDGMEALRAGRTLQSLVEDPGWLLDG